MIISARLVLIVLLASIVAFTTISTQISANTTSAVATNNTSSSPTSTMNIRPNIQTDFNPNATYPKISKFAYVDPFALVIGDCKIGKLVLVAPFAVCSGDEGIPIHIGNYLIYKMV